MTPVAALQPEPARPAARRWTEVPLRARRVRLFTAAPHPALAEDVEHLWWLEAAEPLPGPVVRRCASKAAVDVVFPLDGHFAERAEASLFAQGEPGPYLIGPTSESAEVVSSGRCTAVGARLRPGRAADLLRISARDLRNRVARLAEVCPPEARAAAGALQPGEAPAVATLLEDLLLSLRRHAGAHDPLVAEAVRMIERGRGTLTIAAVARWLGTTVRKLERRFGDRVGLSPKRVGRVVRLDRAMGLLASGARIDFADVVDACGFYDQAHLIREFRELAGITPGGFLRDRRACE